MTQPMHSSDPSNIGGDRTTAGGASPLKPPPPLAPGDEAAPGTPGTAEGLCPVCGGSGRQGDKACTECEGTGKVTVGIGGA
jgi:hypothetical protein